MSEPLTSGDIVHNEITGEDEEVAYSDENITLTTDSDGIENIYSTDELEDV